MILFAKIVCFFYINKTNNEKDKEKSKKREMKIMKEYYSNQTKKNERNLKKQNQKKKNTKSFNKNSQQPRNKIQNILFKNKDKIEKHFNLKNKSLRQMNFCEMTNKLNTTKFLFRSRMVIYPVDMYLEIKRNKLHKEEGKKSYKK